MFGSKGCGALGVLDHPVPLWRLPGGNQVHGTVANQISAANFLERVAQRRPVIGVMITKKRLMEPALLDASHRRNPFTVTTHFFERILLAVIHRRR